MKVGHEYDQWSPNEPWWCDLINKQHDKLWGSNSQWYDILDINVIYSQAITALCSLSSRCFNMVQTAVISCQMRYVQHNKS